MAISAPAPAPTSRAGDGLAAAASASDERRQRVAAQLAASVRELRRSVDLSVQRPAVASYRRGVMKDVARLRARIRAGLVVGGLARQATIAQLVLERETRRVRGAWRAADAKTRIAGLALRLDALAIDAARASGARSGAELNAFKKAHASDARYAGRRWLVDRAVNRQGAVLIARGVRNARLRGAIEELYRPGARVGDGGAADALLVEAGTGCRSIGCDQFVNAVDRRRQLLRIRTREPLSAVEQGIADDLLGTLTKAIRAAGGA
ncbi:MAG: hypothetical protein ACR2H2_18845 [Solirubrobacteraceae bacterium]